MSHDQFYLVTLPSGEVDEETHSTDIERTDAADDAEGLDHPSGTVEGRHPGTGSLVAETDLAVVRTAFDGRTHL